MKKIKAQNMGYDFNDAKLRGLSGDLENARRYWASAIEQAGIALEKLEEFKGVEQDSGGMDVFSLSDIQQNDVIDKAFGALGYMYQMVPDFGRYFEQSG